MKKVQDNSYIKILVPVFFSVLFAILVFLYIHYINKKAEELTNDNGIIYVLDKKIKSNNGFYKANIKTDLIDFLKRKNNQNYTSIIYKIDGENYYFVLDIIYTENNNLDECTFNIDKIVDKTHSLNARINYKNVENVEYKTSDINNTFVLKINSDVDTRYLAVTDNTYYFLGSDIEEITYKNNHFYYLSYNSEYEILKNATNCSDEIKNKIDNFSYQDYYYKYGKINFLNDYYQKLASTIFTVKERCDELESLTE